MIAVLVLLPIVAVAGVLVALNTSAGQHAAERLLAHVLGPNIVVTGISGSFPGAPRVGHAELRDANGVWLTADNIALDWSPLELASRVAHAQLLSIGHVGVLRLPVSSKSTSPSSSSGGTTQLPVRVVVDAARVDRIDIQLRSRARPSLRRRRRRRP